MTVTAGRVIERALKRILVGAADAAPEADEYADALDDLNDFMAALESRGIRLGYTIVDNVSDVVTVPAGAILPIIANLAVTVAPDYSAAVSAALAAQAAEGMNTLRKLGRPRLKAQYPLTLPRGAGNDDTYQYAGDGYFYGNSVLALLSMAGNTLATDIVTADVPVLVAGQWTQVDAIGLRTDVAGRITSLQDGDVSVTVTLTMSATGSGAYTFRLMHNGVSIATDTETLSATPADISITKAVTLEPGDYLEVYVEGDAHTNDPTIADAQFEVL